MQFPEGNRFAILLSNSNESVNLSAALLITRVNKTWPFVQCHAFVDRSRASSLADSFLLKFSVRVCAAPTTQRCCMRKDQTLPQQRIIGRPFCENCKSQMWLACIEPDETNHDKRTFECPVCPNVTVRIVKYRSEAKPQHIGVKYA